MSRSRNSNTKAIIQAITSAKNEIIAEIQRANNGASQSTDFSSIHSPMTMDEMVISEQDDNSKGPMTLNELINSIPDDSNQYASKGPMTLNELINSIPDDSNQYASKGPMTMNELDSPSQNDSPEVVLIAGRSRKVLKSRRMKRTGQSKSRKYRRNTRK